MSAPAPALNAAPKRRRPITIGPLGLPEAIALALGLLLLLSAVLAYFLLWKPNVAELDRLQKQRTDARAELLKIQAKRSEGETVQQSVDSIAGSITRFERAYLTRRETGRLVLYRLLNDLMKRNGVRNTSGPTYAALEPLKPEELNRRANNAGQAGQKGNDRFQTIYPGLSVNMTVEGKYADLRRFVRDLEATGQFIIINTVELEGSRDQNKDNPANNANLPVPEATTPLQEDEKRRGERVNLRLDLAAYFQRDNLAQLTAVNGNGGR